ncbi:MAG: hypothetical protein QM831_24275 [Kofleriaceae bacterium]
MRWLLVFALAACDAGPLGPTQVDLARMGRFHEAREAAADRKIDPALDILDGAYHTAAFRLRMRALARVARLDETICVAEMLDSFDDLTAKQRLYVLASHSRACQDVIDTKPVLPTRHVDTRRDADRALTQVPMSDAAEWVPCPDRSTCKAMDTALASGDGKDLLPIVKRDTLTTVTETAPQLYRGKTELARAVAKLEADPEAPFPLGTYVWLDERHAALQALGADEPNRHYARFAAAINDPHKLEALLLVADAPF